MITLREVSKNLPLTLSYGNLDNDALLLDYGFFVRGNPHDFVGLQFTLDLIQVDSTDCIQQQASVFHLHAWASAITGSAQIEML